MVYALDSIEHFKSYSYKYIDVCGILHDMHNHVSNEIRQNISSGFIKISERVSSLKIVKMPFCLQYFDEMAVTFF